MKRLLRFVVGFAVLLSGSVHATVCFDMDWLILNHTVEKNILYSPSSPIKTKSPHYSFAPLVRDAEGWVKLKATINHDGTIQNAKIIDSNATRILEEASVKAVESWLYEPVEVKEDATAQANAIIQFDFKNIRIRPLVAKAFDYRYQMINSDIEAGELDNIPDRIKTLDSLTDRFRYRSSLLIYDALINHLYSRYYQALGDNLRRQAYLEYAFKAISHVNYEVRDMLAFELIAASADVGAFQTVKNTYRSTFFGIESDYAKQAETIYKKVHDIEQSEPQLNRELWVNKTGIGYHLLNMKHFSFSHTDAPLEKVLVSCGDRVTDLTIERGQVASIPKNWGQCLVTVEGQPDSALRIVEYENNPFTLTSS